jgi:Protein of unknown function (DUF2946)
MRRRLRKFLPIVMIALLVQILAPIAACWAAGIAISDPLAAAVICHDNSAQTNGGRDQTGGHQAHDGSCSLCCAAQAAASADTPQATLAAPYRHGLRVVWHHAALELPGSPAGSHAQARAPPSIS